MAERARDLLENLMAEGRYHFTTKEAGDRLHVSDGAVRVALHRLAAKKRIASPARGFYIIVPPEYRRIGALPAEQFIPALMAHLELRYYVALLSAAQLHGAAHQRPQRFQVMLERNRRPIHVGAVRVEFIARNRIAEVPTVKRNTPRGELVVATPEATAIDLVGYPEHAGGLEHVVSVLVELADVLEHDALVHAARSAPVAWAQRLGYLLETYTVSKETEALASYVAEHATDYVPLISSVRDTSAPVVKRWKLRVNSEFEADL